MTVQTLAHILHRGSSLHLRDMTIGEIQDIIDTCYAGVDIDRLTADLTPDEADTVAVYDAAGAANGKVALSRLHAPSAKGFEVFDDFLYQTITEADTPWILNSGADAQAIDPAINAQEGGVIRLTSGDAGSGVANDGSQLVCHIPVQADTGGLVFETRLHINTAVTTVQVVAGLTDSTSLELPASVSGTTVTTNLSNGCVFVYDTNATTDEWYAVGVDGDTDATGNAITGTAPTADTYQVLRIEVDADGEGATFYIDGTLAGTLTAAATAASTNLYATVIVNATTTTSRTVDVDYVRVRTNR